MARLCAEYRAIALLVGLGAYVLRFENEEDETERVSQLIGPLGWAMLLLGSSISLDELAIGCSLGLLHLPTIPTLIFIAVQAFLSLSSVCVLVRGPARRRRARLLR